MEEHTGDDRPGMLREIRRDKAEDIQQVVIDGNGDIKHDTGDDDISDQPQAGGISVIPIPHDVLFYFPLSHIIATGLYSCKQ